MLTQLGEFGQGSSLVFSEKVKLESVVQLIESKIIIGKRYFIFFNINSLLKSIRNDFSKIDVSLRSFKTKI